MILITISGEFSFIFLFTIFLAVCQFCFSVYLFFSSHYPFWVELFVFFSLFCVFSVRGARVHFPVD